jgi:hypothetical protein
MCYIFYPLHSFNTYSLRYRCSIYKKPEHFYTIEIEKFDKDEIENIKEKLYSLNSKDIMCEIPNIVMVLHYYIENESRNILSQMDGFLFEKFTSPLLEIKNVNAKYVRNNMNNYMSLYAYKICKLDKLYSCV